MIELREAQVRRCLMGWSWRLWWRQATFITSPGWFPGDRGRHRCQGWALTQRGAIRAAERHLLEHSTPRGVDRRWRRVTLQP